MRNRKALRRKRRAEKGKELASKIIGTGKRLFGAPHRMAENSLQLFFRASGFMPAWRKFHTMSEGLCEAEMTPRLEIILGTRQPRRVYHAAKATWTGLRETRAEGRRCAAGLARVQPIRT